MKHQRLLTTALAATSFLASGCANFRRLADDLDFLDRTYTAAALVGNVRDHGDVMGFVMEWDGKKVTSGDYEILPSHGVFGFFVEHPENQYMMAYADRNHNRRYDPSEPAWIHSDDKGRPVPLHFDADSRRTRVTGNLSSSTILPPELVAAAREFVAGRSPDDVATGWSIPVDLGTVADLDDPRFSSERGARGYWEPASYPMETGMGIYFLEPYDPQRIPVLFVYGAAGSPQDWRTIFSKLDRKKYQAWFVHYPTGRSLAQLGSGLNDAVELLRTFYGFPEIHVVAHSMGGLVSRDFILKNLDDGHRYIGRYVTISTPWGGQEFAASGVKRAPSVIPSWRDLVPGSDFQDEVFRHKLRGRVDHLLLYGHHSKRSMTLPKENDGTVSVKSETDPRAVKDAVEVVGFDEDHVSILSNDEVIARTFRHLDGN
ncbi:lipase/acyltransferase domain-containing protein [Luteolibacter marinus]|uniref:PGAP1-like alpha/beta domain-containing protein n=1 Tax=Luteolibacter marinus TaxID=2776705 RepID=UPI00186813CE|nr:alpha/beta hydrolase [Luteolibacter marinus]